MKAIFTITTVDHAKVMLTKRVSALKVIEILRSSYSVNYFDAIRINADRYVCPFGPTSYRSSGQITTIQREVACYKAPIYLPTYRYGRGREWLVNDLLWRLRKLPRQVDTVKVEFPAAC